MISMRSFSSTALVLTASLAAGSLFAAGYQTIREAREAPLGTAVTVKGVVTVPSGSFSPNDEGFAIQFGRDGIYVHESLGGNYTLGQAVIVSGVTADSFGQVRGITPSNVTVIGNHPLPYAKRIATGDISEASEGHLVTVRATVVDAVIDDPPYGYIIHVDDGSGELTVFVYTGTGIDVSGIVPGSDLQITGFSGQFIDHYELNPRFQSDIVIH